MHKRETTYDLLKRLERKIDALKPNIFLDKEYLTIKEACVFLGISRSRLWQMTIENKITKIKLAGSSRIAYKRSELEALFIH